MFYLNNCRRRNHKDLFGPDAFYDLNVAGFQSPHAAHIRVGDEFIVATPNDDGLVMFSRWVLSGESIQPDDHGKPCRVLRGTLQSEPETITKRDAAQDPRYATFFNKNGHFKRLAVLRV